MTHFWHPDTLFDLMTNFFTRFLSFWLYFFIISGTKCNENVFLMLQRTFWCHGMFLMSWRHRVFLTLWQTLTSWCILILLFIKMYDTLCKNPLAPPSRMLANKHVLYLLTEGYPDDHERLLQSIPDDLLHIPNRTHHVSVDKSTSGQDTAKSDKTGLSTDRIRLIRTSSMLLLYLSGVSIWS